MKNQVAVLISFLILVSAIVFSSDYFQQATEVSDGLVEKVSRSIDANLGSEATTVFVPAVDSDGNGVLGKLEVQVIPGSGKTLTNIDHLLFFVDTQFSIQIAKLVAANMTGLDLSKYNIVFDIDIGDNETRVIEGPSAGAALTIATIAELQGAKLNPTVMITGTVNTDGTIGRVGSIEPKVKAAKEGGANIFLVPEGQGLRGFFKVETTCEQVGRIKVCRTEYVEQPTISYSGEGIAVIEVNDIQEALKYFLQ